MPRTKDEEVPPPARPPIRTMTPNAIHNQVNNNSNNNDCGSVTDNSTVATADIPPPPPLRSREQAPPLAPASSASLRATTRTTTNTPSSGNGAGTPDGTTGTPDGSRRQAPVPPPSTRTAGRSSNTTTARPTAAAEDGMMSENQFQVKSFMAALGTQGNANMPRIVPGAIPVQGVNSQGTYRSSSHSNRNSPQRAAHQTTAATRNTNNSYDDDQWDNVGESSERIDDDDDVTNHSRPVVAQLAPNEADVEARLAERLERQITEQWQERLKQEVEAQLYTQRAQQQHQHAVIAEAIVTSTSTSAETASGGSHHYPPASTKLISPLSTTPDHDNFKVCGLRRRTWGFVLLIAMVLMAGAAVGVVFYLRSQDGDDGDTTASRNTPLPTLEPSAAPTPNNNLELLRQELEPWIAPTEGDLEPLDDPFSPQSLALQWLSKDRIGVGSQQRPTAVALERYILAVLYFSSNGPNWKRQNTLPFLTDESVCNWNTGPLNEDSMGVYCDSGGVLLGPRVRDIYLIQVGLDGTIPWELSLLSGLEFLELDQNSLRGNIPEDLGKLTSLQGLWLATNFLTGPLPSTLASTMESMDFTGNDLTGTLPKEWGRSLPLLYWLGVGLNDIDGSLPSDWQGLGSLEYLDLEGNQISGTIPPAFGTQWRSAHSLFFEKNQLEGPLPTTLGQLSNLVDFLIYDNFLTGTVPTEMARLTSLQSFSFEGNSLTGLVDPIFCTEPDREWQQLEGDCLANNLGKAQIQCTCCTTCCTADGIFCEVQ